MNSLSYDVAVGCMRNLADIGRAGFLDGQGVSQHDFDLLSGDMQWQSTDRNRMATVFLSLMNAGVDRQGIPRFNLPAEYLAAGIAMFISGVNTLLACQFVCELKPVSAEAAGSKTKVEPCLPDQIFGLVAQLFSSTARNDARARFEKNTGVAIGRVTTQVSSDKKK